MFDLASTLRLQYNNTTVTSTAATTTTAKLKHGDLDRNKVELGEINIKLTKILQTNKTCNLKLRKKQQQIPATNNNKQFKKN